MAQEEQRTDLKEEDVRNDLTMDDDRNNNAFTPARDPPPRTQARRPLSRIDTLEHQLGRNVQDYGKWVETQFEDHQEQAAIQQGVIRGLRAETSELKDTLASKEAALALAKSDLDHMPRATPSTKALENTNAQLRDQLRIEREQRAQRDRDLREAQAEAARLRAALANMLGPVRDPRLNRGTYYTMSKRRWTDSIAGNHIPNGPGIPRGPSRGRIGKR